MYYFTSIINFLTAYSFFEGCGSVAQRRAKKMKTGSIEYYALKLVMRVKKEDIYS